LKFTDFGFDERLIEGIEASGYNEATPVQEQVIPLVLAGKDVIASAQTGTGKTAAFLLPLINNIISSPLNHHSITALVIVPTRELAIQIAQHMEGLSYFTSVSSIAVYGGGDGNAFIQEKKALSVGADVVICTPGKMLAHINMGYVKFQGLKYLILDEADRMLDMGFYDDIMRIIAALPAKRQNLHYFFDVMNKAHIQHTVGFIQHEHFHEVKVHITLVHQIKQPSRGRNQDVSPIAQCKGLSMLRNTAENNLVSYVGKTAIGFKTFTDLHGQFSCWR